MEDLRGRETAPELHRYRAEVDTNQAARHVEPVGSRGRPMKPALLGREPPSERKHPAQANPTHIPYRAELFCEVGLSVC